VKCYLMFCYPIYIRRIIMLAYSYYYPRLEDILYYTCLTRKWLKGMIVYAIREEYQMEISLLDRHFKHVNNLVAISCDWDCSLSVILESRITIEKFILDFSSRMTGLSGVAP
jgi:hypothetical protein